LVPFAAADVLVWFAPGIEFHPQLLAIADEVIE
jgi:hypothetical protein